MAKRNRYPDITGQTFGRLYVKEFDRTDKHGHKRYNCQCECGVIKSILAGDLIYRRTNSCGCLRREKLRAKRGEASFNALFSSYKRNAKNKNNEFELTRDEFRKITKQKCHYCGCLPAQRQKTKGGHGEYVYNGLDRVANSKGYLLSNIVACCEICNKMKRTLSIEEFLIHINKIHRYMSK